MCPEYDRPLSGMFSGEPFNRLPPNAPADCAHVIDRKHYDKCFFHPNIQDVIVAVLLDVSASTLGVFLDGNIKECRLVHHPKPGFVIYTSVIWRKGNEVLVGRPTVLY
jgi:hypothetical protein